MEVKEEIINALDQGKYAVGVFIDLKKAFDTINHSILINKLWLYMVLGEWHWTGLPVIYLGDPRGRF